MRSKAKYRILFAAGGTGGHLFPAIAVAEKVKMLMPEADILFVGTSYRLEAKVVPQLGYNFKSIWIQAFARKLNFDNLLFPFKLAVALMQSLFINLRFRPQVAVGTGGFVSGPVIFTASFTRAKTIILEQNSFPGVTTRLLQNLVDEIHISMTDSLKYLNNKNNIYLTGNPVRSSLKGGNREEALKTFSFNADKKVLLVLGGSLGAGKLNKAMVSAQKYFNEINLQIIWQTGKKYFEVFNPNSAINIFVTEFIDDMNTAYSACDLLVSRAGATTIAEILVLGIPSVLVPSPNVAENHQYYNAKYLADNNAAVMISDDDLFTKLPEVVSTLINDENRLNELKNNCIKLSKPDAAAIVAERVIRYAEKN